VTHTRDRGPIACRQRPQRGGFGDQPDSNQGAGQDSATRRASSGPPGPTWSERPRPTPPFSWTSLVRKCPASTGWVSVFC